MTKANHEEHDLDSQSPVFRPYLKENTAVRHYKDQAVNVVKERITGYTKKAKHRVRLLDQVVRVATIRI
jgi:hypothetical protein